MTSPRYSQSEIYIGRLWKRFLFHCCAHPPLDHQFGRGSLVQQAGTIHHNRHGRTWKNGTLGFEQDPREADVNKPAGARLTNLVSVRYAVADLLFNCVSAGRPSLRLTVEANDVIFSHDA